MEIILVRHAIALDKNIAKTKKIKDSDRKLTVVGKKKFKKHVLNNLHMHITGPMVFGKLLPDMVPAGFGRNFQGHAGIEAPVPLMFAG